MKIATATKFSFHLGTFLTTCFILGGMAASAADSTARRFVIDSHQHYRSEPGYIDKLVRTYRPQNAMACVLTPMSGFEVVRKAAAEFPDVIIPYGRINVDDPGAPAEIEKFAAAGFKGVKMHSPRYNWDDARYFPLYELLVKHEMVALFHTGIASHLAAPVPQYTSMMRMRPGYLDTLTRAFPHLRVQGAHLGNRWYDEAAEAARWAPNLYFDISGSTLLKKQDDLAFFKKVLWWEGPSQHSPASTVYAFEKIVFGTDEPPENLPRVLAQYEAMLDACAVPEPSRRKIFGETMARVLRLNVGARLKADAPGGGGREP
jgi:predicted TIM-barrel fold metal-dependent hydrolase